MDLQTRAVREYDSPPEAVFDRAVDHNQFPRFMKKVGPIPGIVAVEMVDGAAPATGARRRVKLTDGSTVEEELVALTRPSRHAYRWLNPPAFPFSLLVRGAEASWTFTATGAGTRIEWDYLFHLTTPLVYPLALPVVALFRRWMASALAEMAAGVGT